MAVRDIQEVAVFSPTPANRERLAARVAAKHEIAARAVSSAEQASSALDLVICAARSYDETPVLHGDWLAPGTTVVSIGSTLPEQREVDPMTIERAGCIVADMVEEVIQESGDMLAATAGGIDLSGRVSSLADVVGGRCTGRDTPEQIVLYKSVGSALQDVVLAEYVFRRAQAEGLGVDLPLLVPSVSK